jgi:hypothetical protein
MTPANKLMSLTGLLRLTFMYLLRTPNTGTFVWFSSLLLRITWTYKRKQGTVRKSRHPFLIQISHV